MTPKCECSEWQMCPPCMVEADAEYQRALNEEILADQRAGIAFDEQVNQDRLDAAIEQQREEWGRP